MADDDDEDGGGARLARFIWGFARPTIGILRPPLLVLSKLAVRHFARDTGNNNNNSNSDNNLNGGLISTLPFASLVVFFKSGISDKSRTVLDCSLARLASARSTPFSIRLSRQIGV